MSSQDVSDYLLFTGCQPLYVGVDRGQLSEVEFRTLQASAQSRFRAVRLFDESSEYVGPMLFISVTDFPNYVSGLTLEFTTKRFLDSDPSLGIVFSWHMHSIGMSRDLGSSLLDFATTELHRILDRFLELYLRVNGPNCPPSP